MAFDMLEVRERGGRMGMPATVSLINRGKSPRPSCLVGLTAEFAARIAIKRGQTFMALIGTGEHRGLMRLKRTTKGPLSPRQSKGGSFVFDLGYVERFGTEREPREYVNAEIVDADTIQIVMPKWADEVDEPRIKAVS